MSDETVEPVKELYYSSIFTRQGMVPETGLTPAVNYVYRPLTMHQSMVSDRRIAGIGADEEMVPLLIALLRKHLVKWDATKPIGEGEERCVIDFKMEGELELMDPYVIMEIADTLKRRPVPMEATTKNS